jgi:hypothetical protein
MLSMAAGRAVADREGPWVLVKALALAIRERREATVVFMVLSIYWREERVQLLQQKG